MKILAVDFDGVISDSALKSLFVSHNAYCKYFDSKVKRSFGGELFTFDNWEEMQKQYKKEINDYYHSSCKTLYRNSIIKINSLLALHELIRKKKKAKIN